MYILYFDEAGCTGKLPSITSPIAPVLVITGLIIKADFLPYITRDFMNLKKKYFFKLLSESQKAHNSNWIKLELKGSDLRKILAKTSRNKRRPITSFFNDFFKMLNRYECRIVSRVYIKGIGADFKGASVYGSSIQYFYGAFQNYLEQKGSQGIIIGDSRSANQNSQVAHSIFSKKMSASGDDFSKIIEMPTFSHSENSAGLQIADLLASGLLCPIAIETFCKGHINSIHIRDYSAVKSEFLDPVMNLQYRYKDASQKRTLGGIIVSNSLTDLPPASLFKFGTDILQKFPNQKIRTHIPSVPAL